MLDKVDLEEYTLTLLFHIKQQHYNIEAHPDVSQPETLANELGTENPQGKRDCTGLLEMT